MTNTADFSFFRKYRYTLTRTNLQDNPDKPERNILWVMLNPSSADKTTTDPTVTRVFNRSKKEGFTGLLVINLCPMISSYSDDLRDLGELELLDTWPDKIKTAFEDHEFEIVVCAWGGSIDKINKMIRKKAVDLIKDKLKWRLINDPNSIKCLGRTTRDHPFHPLRKSKEPLVFFNLDKYTCLHPNL